MPVKKPKTYWPTKRCVGKPPFLAVHLGRMLGVKAINFCFGVIPPIAALGTPFVKRDTPQAVLTAQLGHRGTSQRLLQNSHNLAIAISGFTHRISFVENSTLKHYDFLRGITVA